MYKLNYGTGTTVYQGDNRFSLRDIQFYQNILELKQEDKFFIRNLSIKKKMLEKVMMLFLQH